MALESSSIKMELFTKETGIKGLNKAGSLNHTRMQEP